MDWQLLTAICVVAESIAILLQRVLMHRDKGDPVAYVITFQGLAAIIFTVYALIQGFVMPDFGKLWFPALVNTVFFGAGHVIYARTLQRVEASIFAILLATFSAWVMVFGFFVFHDRPDIWQLIGALCIFASVAVVAERNNKLKLDRGIAMGLLVGLFFGVATTAWVYVGRHADPVSWNAIAFAAPALMVSLCSPKSVPKIKAFLHGDMLIRILLVGILYSIASITQLLAFKQGNVSLVAPLLQTSIIVTILLAVVFLRERTRLRQKFAAALICFIGVLLIL